MTLDLNRPFGIWCSEYLVARKGELGGKMGQQTLAEECQVAFDRWTAFQKARKTRSKPVSSPSEEVEAIYTAYPKKKGRESALKAIGFALNRVSYDKLLARVQLYASYVERWPKEKREFVPMPATWFNDARWLDDENEWEVAGMKPAGQPPKRETISEIPGWLPYMRRSHPGWIRFQQEAEPTWSGLMPDEKQQIQSLMAAPKESNT